ncbi:alpha/beta fold hydrolase [Ammoniphilus sp. 3BR4]|uniref:alpha/beta fold hydrolase n=1 Tax=Ammoniphilus sp. 3BR4 TaxID=3158265 RepID=UPI0034650C6A
MSTPYTRNPLMQGFTEGYFVANDGVKIRYLHKGSGMPLIFVPAFGCMADGYALNAPAFTDNFSVYVLEMRGHGFSDAPAHGAHIFRLSADLHEFIASLNAPKVNLIGWSMGCAVIWGYIELFGQDKINKLVFDDEPPYLSANPYDSKEEILQYGGNHLDIWHIHHVYSRNFDDGWPVAETYFERPYNYVTPETSASLPDNYAEKMALMPERPKVDKAHGQFLADLIRDHLWLDWRGIFPLIKVPVLYLVGDLSHCMTPECNDWVSKTIPNCKLVRFTAEEFGNHDLCWTAYKKFNDSVMEFLK